MSHLVQRIYEYNGVTIYIDDSIGILIDPTQMLELTPTQTADLLNWCVQHNNELSALLIVKDCLQRDPSMLYQLADWIIDTVACGDLADREIKLLVKNEMQVRQGVKDIQFTFSERNSGKSQQRKQGNKQGYVYLLQSGSYYKIGVSKNVDRRIKQLGTLPPFDIELIHTIETDDMFGLETELHARYEDRRVNGEWFELTKGDVEYIKRLGG